MKTFKWRLVTGRDFARSIKWARTQRNFGALAKEAAIKAKLAEKKKSA